MSGMIEAAGEVASGAAWSRAVEPAAGGHVAGANGRAHASTHGGTCLNCGTALAGHYCHQCGQSSHVHRTLLSIGHDLLHGVFHFEGKIWRTVPMLVLHPGALTRRYIAGERAKFVSPLALFLFTVFLMFSVYSAVGPGDLSKDFVTGWQKSGSKLEQARRREQADLARMEGERAEAAAAGKDTHVLDRQLAERRRDMATLAKVNHRLTVAPSGDTINVGSRWRWLNEGLEKARENPGLVIYKVQSAAYKFSWALIFLSTPFVALLFLGCRKYGLYDHATFVTYSISFMSLLVIVLELLLAANAPKSLFAGLLTLAPPVHMFAQLKGAYALSIFSALWRTLFLLLFANLILVLFVLGMIMLEVAH